MKKQLKEELIHLAENVVSLKQQEHVDTQELKRLAQSLYEKLSILEFTEKHLFSSEISEQVKQQEKEVPEESIPQPEPEEESYRFAPDGTQFSTAEAITEPNTEKIKDIVAQMPAETQRLDDMLAQMMPKESPKEEAEDMGGVHYDKLPQFEPVTSQQKEADRPKSLNDRLKKGIQIGLNDRHAFVRHLFDGSTTDYNRVLSQLNTIKSKEEAVNFVLDMVKPDYNNWDGKEEYEIRFLAVVENKFE